MKRNAQMDFGLHSGSHFILGPQHSFLVVSDVWEMERHVLMMTVAESVQNIVRDHVMTCLIMTLKHLPDET